MLDPESEADATRWWEELTERGGEGMVVKPLDFIANGKRGILQPAVKCRVHECVFGVLALESEPVDPRL